MKRLARAAAGLAPTLLCAGCAGWQSALDPHGDQAAGLYHLMNFIMIVCAVVWAQVVAVLAMALRRRPPRAEPLAIDVRTQRKMSLAVAGSVAATVVIITIFTLTSYLVTRTLAAPGEDALSIRVRGLQWWWEVTYPDARPDQSFTTANEIHIPVGRAVRIELAADDVIHSFWVPSLAGKQDLIPGRSNAITVRARRAGVYRGQCAEFCGVQHARMAIVVVAQEPDDFENWRRAQLNTATAPANDEQRTGEQIFLTKACSACHTIRGTTATGTNGPDLTHVADRKTIAAGVLETTRGSLAAWIADPQTLKPGNNMPMVPLSPDELNAVSAYMASLQ
jgi:cytochrome c oxidase subunit 2